MAVSRKLSAYYWLACLTILLTITKAEKQCNDGEFFKTGECHICESICYGSNAVKECNQCWTRSTSDATSTFTSSHQITKEPIKYVIDTDLKVEVEKIKEMDAVMLFVICALCVLVICGIILVLFVFVLRRSWTPRGSGNNPVDTEARLGASGDVEVGVIRHSAGINGHRPIQDHEKHSSDVPGTPSLMENV